MSEVFSMVEGRFGKVVVFEVCHDLVPHVHSELEFGYWLGGGQCRGRVSDEPVVYSESQAVGVNRYQAHDLLLGDVTESVMMLKLYIDEVWFDEHFTHCGAPISFQKAQLIHTDEMKTKCWELTQKILLTKKNPSSIENDVMTLLQITIDNNIAQTNLYPKAVRRKMLDYRLRLALSCINDNMTRLDLMQSLSKFVGVSRSRLYELFKDELQSTPNLIWNCVLLDNATKRIVEKQENVALVSADLGFSTAANFSRFFRGHKGVTPSTYRKGMCMPSTKPTERHELE
jgi:AraC-like DNA-binding protein